MSQADYSFFDSGRRTATVDHLQWVEYPADASYDQPMQRWMLRVIGKGQKERAVPLPVDLVAELAKDLVSRGLGADPQDIGNRRAVLPGKASDAAERAPGLSAGQVISPRQGIAATMIYDQVNASQAIAGGMPIEIAQQNLGHASRPLRPST